MFEMRGIRYWAQNGSFLPSRISLWHFVQLWFRNDEMLLALAVQQEAEFFKKLSNYYYIRLGLANIYV